MFFNFNAIIQHPTGISAVKMTLDKLSNNTNEHREFSLGCMINLPTLIKNEFSIRLLETLMKKIREPNSTFLYDYLIENIGTVALYKAGYYCLKKLIQLKKKDSVVKSIVDKIIQNFDLIVFSQYGSLLVQMIIKSVSEDKLKSFYSMFKSKVLTICISKHSARIVEMSIEYGGKFFLDIFMEEIVSSGFIHYLLKTSHGYYIIDKACSKAPNKTYLSKILNEVNKYHCYISEDLTEKWNTMLNKYRKLISNNCYQKEIQKEAKTKDSQLLRGCPSDIKSKNDLEVSFKTFSKLSIDNQNSMSNSKNLTPSTLCDSGSKADNFNNFSINNNRNLYNESFNKSNNGLNSNSFAPNYYHSDENLNNYSQELNRMNSLSTFSNKTSKTGFYLNSVKTPISFIPASANIVYSDYHLLSNANYNNCLRNQNSQKIQFGKLLNNFNPSHISLGVNINSKVSDYSNFNNINCRSNNSSTKFS